MDKTNFLMVLIFVSLAMLLVLTVTIMDAFSASLITCSNQMLRIALYVLIIVSPVLLIPVPPASKRISYVQPQIAKRVLLGCASVALKHVKFALDRLYANSAMDFCQ